MRVASIDAGLTPPKIIERHEYSGLLSVAVSDFILWTLAKVAMVLILYLAVRYCVIGLGTSIRAGKSELAL